MHVLSGKRVLVIGFGLSGRSAASFLIRRGAYVVAIDRNGDLLDDPVVKELCDQGVQFYYDDASYLAPWCTIEKYDLVVISPGVPFSHKVVEKAKHEGIEVLGEIELACRDLVIQPNKKCVGITGTNGKTTVTEMITHILTASGLKAYASGNVGIPLTASVDQISKDESCIFVIELSSFQLESFTCRCLDAGVLLNITPDHLDRYHSMEDYALAKIRLAELLRTNLFFVEDKCFHDFQYLFKDYQHLNYGYNSNCWIYTDGVFCIKGNQRFKLPEVYQAMCSHEVENIMAAFAICDSLGITAAQFGEGLQSFKKPSHRIEFIRTVDGVDYYDDSKGTNIDAVIRAVESLNSEIILVAGGVDKGFPYHSWLKAFNGKVKAVCAIGQAAPKIKENLEPDILVTLCMTLEEAVCQARSKASYGNVVLLSPGCASFDMFKDYAHRGKEFQRIVNAF